MVVRGFNGYRCWLGVGVGNRVGGGVGDGVGIRVGVGVGVEMRVGVGVTLVHCSSLQTHNARATPSGCVPFYWYSYLRVLLLAPRSTHASLVGGAGLLWLARLRPPLFNC